MDTLMTSATEDMAEVAQNIAMNLFYEKACLDILNKSVKQPLVSKKWYDKIYMYILLYSVGISKY